MPITDTPCPECGHPQASRTQGMSLIAECGHCGWMVATTNPYHPFHDRTPYTVRARPLDITRTTAIARLSATLGIGIHAAHAILDHDSPVAENVYALDVIRLHKLLWPQGLSLQVTPAFTWELDDSL